MQEDRDKDDPAERRGNKKSGRDRDAIEKSVNQQAHQDRVSLVRMHELVSVRFFPEVEMRGDGVLEKMNEQVSAKNEKSGVGSTQMNALRHHLDERRRQHESSSERNEVAKVRPLPMLLHDDCAAEHIRACRRQPQQQTRQNGRHEEKRIAGSSCRWSVAGCEPPSGVRTQPVIIRFD